LDYYYYYYYIIIIIINRQFAFAKETPTITAATLLDPRFKDMDFSSEEKAAAMEKYSNFFNRLKKKVPQQYPSLSRHPCLQRQQQQLRPVSGTIMIA